MIKSLKRLQSHFNDLDLQVIDTTNTTSINFVSSGSYKGKLMPITGNSPVKYINLQNDYIGDIYKLYSSDLFKYGNLIIYKNKKYIISKVTDLADFEQVYEYVLEVYQDISEDFVINKKEDENKYGEKTLSQDITVKCKFLNKKTLEVEEKNEKVIYLEKYRTLSKEVKIGDNIQGKLIKDIEERYDYEGNLIEKVLVVSNG